MKPLRIAYISDLPYQSFGTDIQRMLALRALGHEVEPFAMHDYINNRGFRLWRSIAYRIGLGYPVGTLNGDIIAFAKQHPCDLVWIDKGMFIQPSTVRALRSITGAPVVHYTPDPALMFHRARPFLRSIPEYDAVITTKGYEMDGYRKRGARRLIFSEQGFDPDLFKPWPLSDEERARLGSDVCFVGHCEDNYLRCVRVASQAAENVAVWGPLWVKRLQTEPWLQKAYRGKGVFHTDYAKALCSAKVALGLISKWVPETHTTRTFEIPACGTFMLAERTEEHQSFFEEGKEAEFFDSDEELRDKILYYLKHDDQRRRIAAAGRERCVQSGYSYEERLRKCLEAVVAQ